MIPDLDYIKRTISIFEVAAKLDLKIVGKMVHCWRPKNHQHGDRTASVGLHSRRNVARCFVCDMHALSSVDLVMSVRGIDFQAALQWITSQFEVPPAPKGKHIHHRERFSERFRIGTSGWSLETLIRSGLWAALTPAQRSIVPVLQTFVDSETCAVTISYRGIMRYSGVRSQSTVAVALKRFQRLHFLRVEKNWADDGFRGCNTYRLSFEDPEFEKLARAHHQQQREEIDRERELRAQARSRRRKAINTSTDSVHPLENC